MNTLKTTTHQATNSITSAVNLDAALALELLHEMWDVAAMFEEVGVTVVSGNAPVTLQSIMQVQQDVLASLANGFNGSELQKIADKIHLFPDMADSAEHKADRTARAVKKIENRMLSTGIKTQAEYVAYQIVEELGEVAEVLVREDTELKAILDLQKAVQKIVRFGADTVINDPKDKFHGKTNAERASILLSAQGKEEVIITDIASANEYICKLSLEISKA